VDYYSYLSCFICCPGPGCQLIWTFPFCSFLYLPQLGWLPRFHTITRWWAPAVHNALYLVGPVYGLGEHRVFLLTAVGITFLQHFTCTRQTTHGLMCLVVGLGGLPPFVVPYASHGLSLPFCLIRLRCKPLLATAFVYDTSAAGSYTGYIPLLASYTVGALLSTFLHTHAATNSTTPPHPHMTLTAVMDTRLIVQRTNIICTYGAYGCLLWTVFFEPSALTRLWLCPYSHTPLVYTAC